MGVTLGLNNNLEKKKEGKWNVSTNKGFISKLKSKHLHQLTTGHLFKILNQSHSTLNSQTPSLQEGGSPGTMLVTHTSGSLRMMSTKWPTGLHSSSPSLYIPTMMSKWAHLLPITRLQDKESTVPGGAQERGEHFQSLLTHERVFFLFFVLLMHVFHYLLTLTPTGPVWWPPAASTRWIGVTLRCCLSTACFYYAQAYFVFVSASYIYVPYYDLCCE